MTMDVPTTLALTGALLLSVGAGLFHPGLGLLVFGALCLIAAVLTARVSTDGEPTDEGSPGSP